MNAFFYSLGNLSTEVYKRLQSALLSNDAKLLGDFTVLKSSDDSIEGVFILKKPRYVTISNISGELETVEHVSYERKEFYIDVSNRTLAVWNAGRSAKALITVLSKMSEYSLSFEPLRLNFRPLEDLLEGRFESVQITSFLSQQWSIADNVKARVELVSSLKSITLDDFQKVVSKENVQKVARKTYTLFDGYSKGTLSVSAIGNIKIEGNSEVVQLLRENLNMLASKV